MAVREEICRSKLTREIDFGVNQTFWAASGPILNAASTKNGIAGWEMPVLQYGPSLQQELMVDNAIGMFLSEVRSQARHGIL
jgi:hypothetical protein